MKKLHFFLSLVSSPVLCSCLSLLDACKTMRSEGTVHYWECFMPHWLHTLRGLCACVFVCVCVCFCACCLLQALWTVALLRATFFISQVCFSCAWFTVPHHRVDSHSTLQVVVVPLRVSLSTLGFSVTPPSRDEVADAEVSALVCSLLPCVPSPSCG